MELVHSELTSLLHSERTYLTCCTFDRSTWNHRMYIKVLDKSNQVLALLEYHERLDLDNDIQVLEDLGYKVY